MLILTEKCAVLIEIAQETCIEMVGKKNKNVINAILINAFH